MPKDPKGQNNIENENVKLDSQSVQNENSANMFVQIELGSDYDLKQILSSGKYGNNNIIAEENQNGGTELVDFDQVQVDDEGGYFEKAAYTSFSAIKQLVFRARYVAANDGDIECLDNADIWNDPKAEKIINQIADDNDSLCNELEGYYLSKCKPVANEDNSLTELEKKQNEEYNLSLIYNIASVLSVRTNKKRPEDTVARRLDELEKIIKTNSSYDFNAEQTFDFLDNVFMPTVTVNTSTLNTKLVGRHSETKNNEFIPTEDFEFAENKKLIASVRLSDLKEQTNLSNEAVSAIVAGCFLRSDVLGSTYDQTYSDLENAFDPLPRKKIYPSEQFDTMVDTFFTYTAGGDNRRSANIPLLAVPKARQMARFALGNLTQLSDKRAVVEALENVIRVAGKYAIKHTKNDHALYAASKLVNDAMIALDMPQFREISTLTSQERNMARGVSNLYLANVDLIKLNYELHDALIDHRANDTLKDDTQTGKKPMDNDDVKRVFDSIYVRRHYIESHLKMAAQYGDKMRPLTSEELTCALNPAKYFDSLIKGNTVVKAPKDILSAKNVEEFNEAFESFNNAPISNSEINTISAAKYNEKLSSALNYFAGNRDLLYCADRSKALTKFYTQLEKGLRPISSDLLSLYEIKQQRKSINSLRSYLNIESPYSTPFAQVILGSLLQDKDNRNPDIKNIKEPYTLEHFNPRARKFLFDYEGPQPGNVKRIKTAVKDFVATLNELDQMLDAVELSRQQESDFISDCINDPEKPLGPDIEAQFKKKGIDGVSKTAMVSKSYKPGQSLGLSELLIHLQENYKSSPKSLIVKKSLAEAKKNTSQNTVSDVASRATKQSRQSRAVQSIRSFVSTRSDMSSVSRADNSYSITIEDLEVLKDDLSVDKTVGNNEKILKEVEQLKAAKKEEKKKKHIKKGPSTNWGVKLDPKAEKGPSQLDILSDLSKDTSVKVLALPQEEQQRIYKETIRKKLELDTEKVKKSVEAKYSNVKSSTGLALIEEEDEDKYEEVYDENSANIEGSKLASRIIDTNVLDAEFDPAELLNAIQPEDGIQNEGSLPQNEQAEVDKKYKMPKSLRSFNRTVELVKPVDEALETIDQCLNGQQLIEEEKLAIDSIRPILEKTQKYYEEFRNTILSGTDGLNYLYDESGKPTPQFITMEICRRLYKNTLELPQKDSGVQVNYKALVDTVSEDLTAQYKQYKNPDSKLTYNGILLPSTNSKKLSEEEIIEEAFNKTKTLALDPERLKQLRDIPNPGIHYIVNNAEALYSKLKNTKFADIESDLVDQTGYSYVPQLDYITMRLFSSINSNYDKYAENPNLFNINQEIEKLENELAEIKQEGNVFAVTQDNVYYLFGVETPQESKIRRTNEKFALKDQAVKIKETLTKALSLGGEHYQKLVRDGINCLNIFIGEFAEFGENRITPTLSDDMTRITTIKATASQGARKIRHAHNNLTYIQTAINLVNKVVKNNEYSLYDFESAKQASEERRTVDLKFIDKIDQVSNQSEDFAIKLYTDMFNSMPKNIDRYIEALGKGITEKKEYLEHKAELEELAEQKRIAEENAKAQAKKVAEEKAFQDFREKFDKKLFENKDETLTRLKAQKYICDEIIEHLDDSSFVDFSADFRQLANEMSDNCDKLISDINKNKSVFDSFVNGNDKTFNWNYARQRIFKNIVAIGVNNDISVQFNNKTEAGKKIKGKDTYTGLAREYTGQKFDKDFFLRNVTFLGDFKIDDINKIIEIRERKLYERTPEYAEKVENGKRIAKLLKFNIAGKDYIDNFTVLKSAFDQYAAVNSGNTALAALAQSASAALNNVISNVNNKKHLFTSLLDSKNSKLSPDGAALFTAFEVFNIETDTAVPTISLNMEGFEKYRAALTDVFDLNKLPSAVPVTEQCMARIKLDVITEYRRREKDAKIAKENLEKKLNSPLESKNIRELRNIILDNGVDIVNSLVVQKIALDKVLTGVNEKDFSPSQKQLAKLGSDACADLVRKITNEYNFVNSIVTNSNGNLKYSENLAVIAYCKQAFNISKGDIAGKAEFDEKEISGKSSDELKAVAMRKIVEPMEQSPSINEVENILKDDSLQSGFIDIDTINAIDAAKFDIDDVNYYTVITEQSAQIEDEEPENVNEEIVQVEGGQPNNAVNMPNAVDFVSEKRQIRELDFGPGSKGRFAAVFTRMTSDLKKQDAWYHKNSDDYNKVLDKLGDTITKMQDNNVSNERDLLKNYSELNSVCEIYLNKRRSSKFFTDWGRNRFNQISEIRDIASARIESIGIAQYKDAIAEKIALFLMEKTKSRQAVQNQPTQSQIAAQIANVKKNPIYKAVILDKGLDELRTLSREPHTLAAAIKSASVEVAKVNKLFDIKNKAEVAKDKSNDLNLVK